MRYNTVMARRRRWGKLVAGVVGVYALTMLLGGVALRGCVEDRVADRLGRALGADVSIGSSSFSLWRGVVELNDVRATRPDGGTLELHLGHIRAEVAGWGWVIFDHAVDRAVVRDVEATISATGAIDVARIDRHALPIAELVVDNVHMQLMPTTLFPGLGQVDVRVTHAVSRPVVLQGATSWLRGLAELDSAASLPGGLEVSARYRARELELGGGLFGSDLVRVPFEIPELDPEGSELDHIRTIATAIVKAAGKHLVKDFVRDKVFDKVRGLIP